MIDGVILTPKLQIPDERGAVKLFIDTGESFCSCYTTMVYRGIRKGWHGYPTKTLNYVVPIGLVKLVLYDHRQDSSTYGQVDVIFLGEMNYQMVTIPPRVMNAFQGIAHPFSLAVVVADETFDENKTIRWPIDNLVVPHDWSNIEK